MNEEKDTSNSDTQPTRRSALGLMALALGYFVWGDVPTPSMLAGVALIIGACVLIFRRGQPLPEPPEGSAP